MAANLLTDKTIRAALKKGAAGDAATLNDGEGLTLIVDRLREDAQVLPFKAA